MHHMHAQHSCRNKNVIKHGHINHQHTYAYQNGKFHQKQIKLVAFLHAPKNPQQLHHRMRLHALFHAWCFHPKWNNIQKHNIIQDPGSIISIKVKPLSSRQHFFEKSSYPTCAGGIISQQVIFQLHIDNDITWHLRYCYSPRRGYPKESLMSFSPEELCQ